MSDELSKRRFRSAKNGGHQLGIREFLQSTRVKRPRQRLSGGAPPTKQLQAPLVDRVALNEMALGSIYSLAWSHPVNREIGRLLDLLSDQTKGPFSWMLDSARARRAKTDLIDQLYRWRISFYGRDISGVDPNTQLLKQLRNLGEPGWRRFRLGRPHQQAVETLERIGDCHEALVRGILYEKEGYTSEELAEWANSIASQKTGLDVPPMRSADSGQSLEEPVRDQIKAPDGWGYAIAEGRLWLWNPQEQVKAMLSLHPGASSGWHRTEIEAMRVGLGSNGLAYLITKNGIVVRLPDGNETVQDRTAKVETSLQEGGLIQIPLDEGETVKSFSVSPAGSIVYSLGQPGEFHYIPHTILGSIFASAVHDSVSLPVELNPFKNAIVAMAFDRFDTRGSLYLQDQDGKHYRAHLEEGGRWNFERLKEWKRLPHHLQTWFIPGREQSLNSTISDQFFGQMQGPTGYSDLSVFGYVHSNRRRIQPGQPNEERWRDRFLSFLRPEFRGQKLTTRWGEHWRIFFHEFTPMAFRSNVKEQQLQADAEESELLKTLVDPVSNVPGRLLKKHNFAHISEFSVVARPMRQFNEGVRDPASQLARALRARDPKINIVEQYQRMVGELKPGESIQIPISRGRGLDGDGAPAVLALFRLVLTLLSLKHLPPEFAFINAFNVRYTPAWMKRSESVFTITKTMQGIDFSCSCSMEKERSLLSANFSLGGGTVLSTWRSHRLLRWLPKHLTWFFAGAEYHGTRGKNERSEITATWSILHDDQGSVPRFVKTFFSGELNPTELLSFENSATVTVGEFKSKLRTHPFQVLPGVVGWTQNFWLHMQSEQLYGRVRQRVYGKTDTTGSAITRGPNGITVERVVDMRARSVADRIIDVGENQFPDPWFTLFRIPNLLRFNLKEHPLVRVRTKQDRKRKSRWEQRAVSHGYDLFRSPDQEIFAVRVEVRTDNPRAHDLARTDRIHSEAEHFTDENVPQLRDFKAAHPKCVDDIKTIQQSGEPVTTILELEPDLLRVVQAFDEHIRLKKPIDAAINPLLERYLNKFYPDFAGLSQDRKGLLTLITELRDCPEHWQIIRIEAAETKMHIEDSSPGVLVWRARRSAAVAHNRPNAVITHENTLEVQGSKLRPGVPANFELIRQTPQPTKAEKLFAKNVKEVVSPLSANPENARAQFVRKPTIGR